MEYLCESSLTGITPLLCPGKNGLKRTMLLTKLIPPYLDLKIQVLSFCVPVLWLSLYHLNFQRAAVVLR